MSFSKKIRSASLFEAREAILLDTSIPNFVADAVREIGSHAPHLGPNREAGEVDGAELEITVSGHVADKDFDVSVSIRLVAAEKTASKKTR